MLELNLNNVEDLIFYDTEVQKVFPVHYFSVFEQWRISKRIPAMKSLGKQALLDFLNIITDEEVVALETYLGERVRVERLNYSLVANLKWAKDDKAACDAICTIQEFGNLTVWRDEEFVYVTFWR